MLRICISGLSASGKTTVGEALAKELDIMHITKSMTKTYKRFVDENGGPKEASNKIRAETSDPKYADDFDKEVVALAKKNDCVVTTWLGPWMVKDATLRIWLNTCFDERAHRRAVGKHISLELARVQMKEKDDNTIRDFKKVYGIDIMDHRIFDIEINTERFTRQEEVAVIAMLALGKQNGRFK